MSLNQHQFYWSSKQDYSMVIGVSQPSVSNMQARTSKWMNNWKGWRLRNRKYLFQIWTILSQIELTATWSLRWKECLGEQIYQRDYVTCYTDSDTISIFFSAIMWKYVRGTSDVILGQLTRHCSSQLRILVDKAISHISRSIFLCFFKYCQAG